MKDTVHNSGWLWFIAGLLMATFFGGAIRSLLSERQLNVWVQNYIQERNPPVNISYKGIELVLGENLLPKFGVRIRDVKVSAKNQCITRSQILVNEIYFPVDIYSLFAKKVKFKNVAADQVDLLLQQSTCKTSEEQVAIGLLPVLAEEIGLSEAIKNGLNPLIPPYQAGSSFIRERWRKEATNTAKWIEGLSVAKLNVFRREKDKPVQLFTMDSLVFELDDEKLELEIVGFAQFFPLSSWRDNFGLVNFSVRINPQEIQIDLRGQYKEGSLKLSMGTEVKNQVVYVQTKLQDLPVNSLLTVLSGFDVFSPSEELSLFWFSCLLTATADFGPKPFVEFNTDSCKVSGDDGSIKVSDVNYNVLKNKFSGAKFSLSHVNMKNLYHTFRSPILKYFNDSDTFVDGELEFKSFNEAEFSGNVQHLPIRWNLLGEKWQTTLDKMPLKVSYSKGRISTMSQGILWHGYPVKGFASTNMSSDLKDGVFQIRLDRWPLAGSVEMVKKERETASDSSSETDKMEPDYLELFAQGTIKKGDLHKWRADAGAVNLRGEDWQAKHAKMSMTFADRVLSGKASAKELRVAKSNSWQSQLRPLFLEHEGLEDELVFEKIKLSFTNDDEAFRWKSLHARSPVGKGAFASQGEINDGQWQGSILVDFPQLKPLEWKLGGALGEAQITPSAKMLKSLAAKSRSTSILEGFGEIKKLDFLKDFMARELGELKEIGKKVISKTQKVLPKLGGDSTDDSAKPKDKAPRGSQK